MYQYVQSNNVNKSWKFKLSACMNFHLDNVGCRSRWTIIENVNTQFVKLDYDQYQNGLTAESNKFTLAAFLCEIFAACVTQTVECFL